MHHLNDIDRYINRELDGEALGRIDAHVSGCLACATALSERGSAADRWERRGLLGRLVRVSPPEALPAIAEQEEAAAA